jgi:hypothetical protein
MSEPDRYPWVLRRPIRQRHLPPAKPSRPPMLICGRCGWESGYRRKKCPACHALLGGAAATSSGDDR